MKKLLIILSLSTLLFSCTKDVPEPQLRDVSYRLAVKDIDSTYTYPITEQTAFREYITSTTGTNGFGVSLEYFEPFLVGYKTVIEFKTTFEENVDYFVIERSLDFKEYLPVGKPIKPKGASVYRIIL